MLQINELMTTTSSRHLDTDEEADDSHYSLIRRPDGQADEPNYSSIRWRYGLWKEAGCSKTISILVPCRLGPRLFFSTKFWRILGRKPPVGSVFWEISEFFPSKLLSFLWKFTHFRYFCLSFLSKSQLLLSYWWFLSFWPALPPFSVQEKTKNWPFYL